MDVWWFPTIFFHVKIWFIIQLPTTIKINECFRLKGGLKNIWFKKILQTQTRKRNGPSGRFPSYFRSIDSLKHLSPTGLPMSFSKLGHPEDWEDSSSPTKLEAKPWVLKWCLELISKRDADDDLMAPFWIQQLYTHSFGMRLWLLPVLYWGSD